MGSCCALGNGTCESRLLAEVMVLLRDSNHNLLPISSLPAAVISVPKYQTMDACLSGEVGKVIFDGCIVLSQSVDVCERTTDSFLNFGHGE